MDALTRRTIAAAALFLAGAGAASADPAFWRVSDGDSAVWLFGSVHIVSPDANWRSPALDERIANADKVVFEMLMDEAGLAEIGRLTMAHGFLPEGETLTDLLSADERARLEAALDHLGIDSMVVARMQPWMAGVTIATLALTASGTQSFANGVETVIQAEVADDRELGLETAAEQIAIVTAGTREEQIASLMEAVDEVERTDAEFQTLATAWLEGDIETVHDIITESIGTTEDPAYQLFVSDRNARWTEALAQMLADDTEALVIVGTAHLAGPLGVPAMLEERGFTVERIDEGAPEAIPQQ